jgi:hypothetical protein
VSFWIAGELTDAVLKQAFQAGASTILLGFTGPARRAGMIAQMNPFSAS